MSPTLRSAIRRNLLRWYKNNKRDLPWRNTRDPYAVWISETMLQQTQVNTVIPYYEKFMNCFPRIDELARAPLAKVLRLWSGLGYYRRAENLRKAAQQIVRLHAGAIPRDFAQLRALAGIGDYTAGALLSIAFGKPYPAIDGNARRVLSRVRRITSEPALRAIAEELISRSQPGEFNQAVMDLGATICTPKNQRCADCPINSLCASRSRSHAPSTLGPRRPLKLKSVVWPLAIVRHRGKILLRQRATNGLLRGLWELPGNELNGKQSIAALFGNELKGAQLGFTRAEKLGEIRHAITHRRICAPVYVLDLTRNCRARVPLAGWRWIAPEHLQQIATSSMTVKAVAIFSSYEKNLR